MKYGKRKALPVLAMKSHVGMEVYLHAFLRSKTVRFTLRPLHSPGERPGTEYKITLSPEPVWKDWGKASLLFLQEKETRNLCSPARRQPGHYIDCAIS
jgi:hypothetical protein